MAKTEVFHLGSLTFIGEIRVESADGKTGYSERPRLIHDGYGSIDLWGNEEDFRQAAKFFSKLADQQAELAESINRAAASYGCGCSCKAEVPGHGKAAY